MISNMSKRYFATALLCLNLVVLAGVSGVVVADDALPKEVMVRNVEFVLIPEGSFYKTGGVKKANGEIGGNKKIWLDSFYIAKYEARARDLEPFLNQGSDALQSLYGGTTAGCSLRKGSFGSFELVDRSEDLPATHLSWVLADKWANWMGFRLPTEAEWEKAARGSDKRIYAWGDAIPDETYANFGTASSCRVWPVDRLAKGLSPYGVYNLTGNVREFVADWINPEFDEALKEGARNPIPPRYQKERKMLKGGRWADKAESLNIGYRVAFKPNDPFQCNGTRFALDVSAVRKGLADGSATVITP